MIFFKNYFFLIFTLFIFASCGETTTGIEKGTENTGSETTPIVTAPPTPPSVTISETTSTTEENNSDSEETNSGTTIEVETTVEDVTINEIPKVPVISTTDLE